MQKYLALAALLSLLCTSCQKAPKTSPTLQVKYATDQGSIDRSYRLDATTSSDEIFIAANGDSTGGPGSDSVTMTFFSSLTLHGAPLGAVAIAITHTYPKSKLTYADHRWQVTDDADFADAFRQPLTPQHPGVQAGNTFEIEVRTVNTNITYTLLHNADDPAVAFTVTPIGTSYDWSYLSGKYYIGGLNRLTPLLVKATFSGRLVDPSHADTLTVQGLTYQGPFITGR